MNYIAMAMIFVVGIGIGYQWGVKDTMRVWRRFTYHRWTQTQDYVAKIEQLLVKHGLR